MECKNNSLNEIKQQYPDLDINKIASSPFPLEEICDALNIYVEFMEPKILSGQWIRGTIFKNKSEESETKRNFDYMICIPKHYFPPRYLRFTVAHLLGHFIKHKEQLEADGGRIEAGVVSYAYHGEEEKAANQFAAELLMPEYHFREQYNAFYSKEKIENRLKTEEWKDRKKNYGVVEYLADYFWVSPKLASYRIMTLGLDCAQ